MVDLQLLTPVWMVLTFVIVTLGWVPFRAPTLEATALTFAALWSVPDLSFAAVHWGVWLIPLGTLVFCLIDRHRRLQDWLTQRASLPAAVICGVAAVWFLQVFARIDAHVPFVYFQF